MAEPGAAAAGDAAGAPPPRVGAWVPVLVEQMVNDTLVVTLSCGERRFTGVLLDCSKRCGRGWGHRDRGGERGRGGGAAAPPRPLFGRAGQSGGVGTGPGHAAGAERCPRTGRTGRRPARGPEERVPAPGPDPRPFRPQPPRRSLPSPASLPARSSPSSPCRAPPRPGRAPGPGGGSGGSRGCSGGPARPRRCPSSAEPSGASRSGAAGWALRRGHLVVTHTCPALEVAVLAAVPGRAGCPGQGRLSGAVRGAGRGPVRSRFAVGEGQIRAAWEHSSLTSLIHPTRCAEQEF